MQERLSRELMLKRIRQALIEKTEPAYPSLDWEKCVYAAPTEETPEEQFARTFTRIGGNFTFCENEMECLEQLMKLAGAKGWKRFYCWERQLQELLKQVDFPYTTEHKDFTEGFVGLTTCEALVARLGNVIVSSAQGSGRRLFVAPTFHVVIARTSQVVADLKDAFALIHEKYGDLPPSLIASLAGPSRTADIEKTLVTPAHGPQEIHVFMIDDPR
ncbi:MAG: lactate utilization protein C [Bacteroidota bacterium]